MRVLFAMIGAAVLYALYQAVKDPGRKPTPVDGDKPDSAPNWPHFVYAQMDGLAKERGWHPARQPLLVGAKMSPFMFLGDAEKISAYWLAKVKPYRDEQTYASEGKLVDSIFSLIPFLGDVTTQDAKTTNPYRRYVRRMWTVQRMIATRLGAADEWPVADPFTRRRDEETPSSGNSTVDAYNGLPWANGGTNDPTVAVDYSQRAELGFARLAQLANGGVFYDPAEGPAPLEVDELDAFWSGLLSAAQDLKVNEEFNPSEWSIAMKCLGEAAKNLPATLGEWIGTGTTVVVQTATKAAGNIVSALLFAFLGGLLPLVPWLFGAYVVYRIAK